MKDVQVLINPITSQVILNKKRLGLGYENLQGKIVVTFDGDFVDGVAYLEIERNGEKGYLEMTKEENAYTLEIKSSLLNKVGQINMQVRITESQVGDEIPVWKSNIFYLNVDKAINSTAEIPDEYPEWIDTANAKIQEMDNLNIEAEKVGHTTTITITNKDGTETSVEVNDGEPGSPGAPGPKGDTGSQGPAGENGRDGVIQYTAGDNITIENNVISADLTSKQDIIQYATLPTPSVDYLGKIFQYTGATGTYINGHFYLCASDGTTYSWQEISFGGGGSAAPLYHVYWTDNSYILWGEYGTINLTANAFQDLANIFNDAHEKGFTFGLIINSNYNPLGPDTIMFSLSELDFTGSSGAVKLTHFENSFYNSDLHSYGNNNNGQNIQYWNLGVNLTNGVIVSQNSASTSKWLDNSVYLSTSNTHEYIPIQDFNPSTKKYTDDLNKKATNVKVLSLTGALMGNLRTFNKSVVTSSDNKSIFLEMINKALADGLTSVYFTNREDEYYNLFKLLIPNVTMATQSTLILMTPNPSKLVECKVGDLYYVSKTINIIFQDNVATDITVTTSGYLTQTWGYLGIGNTNSFSPTRDYEPSTKKYTDDLAKIESITNSNATYTIASLVGNKSYKLGEITSLTITASTASDYESVIYFLSGSTPTEVTIPDSITNLGDVPTLTTASNVSTGTCTANKNYIIAILNNIAVWKEY